MTLKEVEIELIHRYAERNELDKFIEKNKFSENIDNIKKKLDEVDSFISQLLFLKNKLSEENKDRKKVDLMVVKNIIKKDEPEEVVSDPDVVDKVSEILGDPEEEV